MKRSITLSILTTLPLLSFIFCTCAVMLLLTACVNHNTEEEGILGECQKVHIIPAVENNLSLPSGTYRFVIFSVLMTSGIILLSIKSTPHPFYKYYRIAKRYIIFMWLSSSASIIAALMAGKFSGILFKVILCTTIVGIFISTLQYFKVCKTYGKELESLLKNDDNDDLTTKELCEQRPTRSENKLRMTHESIEKWINDEEKTYLKSGLTVQDVSLKTGIPKRRLADFIHLQYNLSFNSWINTLRVQEVERLLSDKENNAMTLSEIAYKTGFSDLSNMSSTFKKIKGMNPSEYRSINNLIQRYTLIMNAKELQMRLTDTKGVSHFN